MYYGIVQVELVDEVDRTKRFEASREILLCEPFLKIQGWLKRTRFGVEPNSEKSEYSSRIHTITESCQRSLWHPQEKSQKTENLKLKTELASPLKIESLI